MPITLLDIIVLAVMLLSGLLAMIRGFLREVLSIASWGAAALTTLLTFNKLVPPVQSYLGGNEIVAKVAVVAGVFLGTLVIATIITSRISDLVLDSRIGALDRTIGFMFGLARGLLILVVAFVFFDWLVNEKQQPDWVRNAKSLSVLKATGEWLKGQLPDDPEGLYQKYKGRRDEQTDVSPERPLNATVATDTGGYSKSQRDGLRQLIEGKSMTSGR